VVQEEEQAGPAARTSAHFLSSPHPHCLSTCWGSMTRITDFGRKRTYVDAGFASEPLPDPAPSAPPSAPPPAPAAAPDEAAEKPAKKKRKRTPKSKRDNYGKDKPAGADDDTAAAEPAATTPAEELSKRKLRKREKTKEWRDRKST
jgi:zinc finger CCHC domain-containing protein 9